MFSAMYYNIKFHMSNFIYHLILPYKFLRPVDCMLPTACLMYDIRFNKRSVHMRMYCHTIFRGDGVNTQVTSTNSKLVLITLQTNKQDKVRVIGSILFLITKIKFLNSDVLNC